MLHLRIDLSYREDQIAIERADEQAQSIQQLPSTRVRHERYELFLGVGSRPLCRRPKQECSQFRLTNGPIVRLEIPQRGKH